jgi:C-terminal processing protease CtpA/Prc
MVKSATKTKWNSLYSANPDMARRILLRKVFDGASVQSDADWDLIAKYFDKKAINKRLVGKSTDDVVNIIDDLKYCEHITMNTKNKKVFELIIDKARLSSTDLRLLADNIGKIDVAQFSNKELSNLAQQLAKKKNQSAF